MPGNLSRGCPSRHTPSRGPRGGARRGAARGFLYLGGADSRASRAARPRCPHHPPPRPALRGGRRAATLGTALFGERSSLATLGDTYPMSLGDAVTSGGLEYGLNLAAVSAL